jgi:hypothetical protein
MKRKDRIKLSFTRDWNFPGWTLLTSGTYEQEIGMSFQEGPTQLESGNIMGLPHHCP